jgi:REP element-mobilizing transposase RayT
MWTLYGWWLPNDPRGSTSRTIRNDLVGELGELHFGRKQIQPARREVREFYALAANALQHPLLSFPTNQFTVVAEAIGHAVQECDYTCYACAVMPDHIHMVIRKHRDLAEDMIENIQSLSRKRLMEVGLRGEDHPTWTRGGWKVFLDHPDDVARTVRYVEENPVKIGLPRQQWDFVAQYDGWPLHPGHSPQSPYAKALRAAGRYPR